MWRIFPYTTVGILIGAYAQIVGRRLSPRQIIKFVFDMPGNILLLGGFGVTRYNFNAPLWYLSGIIVAMPVIIILMIKQRSFYKYVGCWVFPIVFYMLMFSIRGNIQYWNSQVQIHCLLRAFAGLMVGSVAYYLSEWLNTIEISNPVCWLLTIFEIGSFITIFALSFLEECFDIAFAGVLLFMMTITISFSGKDCVNRFIPRWVESLGALGAPLYCLHRPIYDVVRYYCRGVGTVPRLWIGIGYSFALAVFMLQLVGMLKRKEK